MKTGLFIVAVIDYTIIAIGVYTVGEQRAIVSLLWPVVMIWLVCKAFAQGFKKGWNKV